MIINTIINLMKIFQIHISKNKMFKIVTGVKILIKKIMFKIKNKNKFQKIMNQNKIQILMN